MMIPFPIERVSASTPPITPINPKKQIVAIIARITAITFLEEMRLIISPRASSADTFSSSLEIFTIEQLLSYASYFDW